MSGTTARSLNWQIFYDVVVFLSPLPRRGGAGALLCGLCTLNLLFVTSEGGRMQIQASILSRCKSGTQATAVAGKQNGFFPTTRCVWSMPEDKLSLPENTSCSSQQICCLLRHVQPDVSEVFRDFFPLPQFLPNDRRPRLNSVPFLTHCLTSRAEDPCVVYTCPHFCPPPPITRFLHFSWQSRIIFQGTLGSLCCQNPWSSFCKKENAISLEVVMCARADDGERARSGRMVLKVWGWGSAMMQAAQSTSEDVQHACVWSLAGSEACFKIKSKTKTDARSTP